MKRSRISKGSIAAGSLLMALVALTILSFVYFISPRWGFPFHDSFQAGKADGWKPIGGAWEIANGVMRNDSDERGAKLLAGSKRWKNYVVETDVEILRQGGDAGIIVRSNQEERGIDAYNGYYVGLRAGDNSLVVGRADYGWMEGEPAAMPGGVHSLVWYHLKVVTIGCEIGVFATQIETQNSAWVLFEEPSCVPAGRIGLRSLSTAAAWRNVRVSAAQASELAAIRRHVVRIIHPEFPKSEAAYNATHDWGVAMASSSGGGNQALIPQPLGSLRLLPQSIPHLILVRGVVILTSPVLYVQDSTGGVAVPNIQGQALGIGDEVEIAGWPEPHDYSAILRNATVRLLWDHTPVPPVSITASQAAAGAFDATFVETQGELRGQAPRSQ